MFMWGLHNGTVTWQLYDSNCALYQVILMDGAMDPLDVPNACHLLCKSASVTSQTLGIYDYVRRQNSSFVLCVVGFLWKMRAVCEKPANQASNGSQMRLPCSFTAVSPTAALCCQHGELSFISVTTKKNMEAGVKTC